MTDAQAKTELIVLCKSLVHILERKALKGCDPPTWDNFQNGEGETVGPDISKLIRRAKRNLKKFDFREVSTPVNL